jgi:hypothetical protein
MNNQPLEQQLYDIYGMNYIPWWHSTTFYFIVGVFLCTLIGIILYMLLCYYRAHYYRRTPWNAALRALDELNKNYLRPDQSRMFYYMLTDIMKSYLQERYGYVLTDKTDEECITYLATTDFPHELQEVVKIVLRAGTMSKFADAQVAEHQMHEHVALARNLIKRTIPQRAE